MRTQFKFLVKLHNIQIKENLGRGEEIYSGLFLTNDSVAIRRLLNQQLRAGIGELEYQQFLMSDAVVVYADGEQKELTEPRLALALLINYLYTVQNFLHTLWIVKDHAVNFELGFLQVVPKNGIPYNDSNLVADSRSLSDCSVRSTEFSTEEIRAGKEIFASRFKVAVRPEDFASDSPMFHRGETPLQLASYKEVKRLERFFCFLSDARSSDDLGIKIAMYCTCLEALFTTDSAELTHKISERAAAFLSETVEARVATYQAIKKAYSIRSKVMHGDSISEKLRTELPAVSGKIDEILRAISLKLLSHEQLQAVFMLEREDIENYFLRLTCSGPESQLPVLLAKLFLKDEEAKPG